MCTIHFWLPLSSVSRTVIQAPSLTHACAQNGVRFWKEKKTYQKVNTKSIGVKLFSLKLIIVMTISHACDFLCFFFHSIMYRRSIWVRAKFRKNCHCFSIIFFRFQFGNVMLTACFKCIIQIVLLIHRVTFQHSHSMGIQSTQIAYSLTWWKKKIKKIVEWKNRTHLCKINFYLQIK